MPASDSNDRPSPRLFERVGAASSKRVVRGGESGVWRWLVPVLAVLVLGLFAQRVVELRHESEDATAVATLAQDLATEAVLGEQADVRSHAARLALRVPGDAQVARLTAELSPRETGALASRVNRRYDAHAADRASSARTAALAMVAFGLVLCALLLWSFWSRRADAHLAMHERRFRSLVQNSSDLILVVDDDGVVTECTPVAEQMLARRPADLLGTPFADLVHPNDGSPADGGAPGTRGWRAAHADGGWVDVESSCTDLREDASVGGLVLVVRDVRERKAFEQQLHHAAFHDALTGLPNRALFEDRVRQAGARARRAGGLVAVLFVDLDDFKTVNDSLGHAAGDDLLRQTAARLDACLRAEDTAARLGGDEFAVLVEGMSTPDDVTTVAERIHEALDGAFRIGDEEIFVRASIGIALREADQLDDELMRNADTAMYAAKAAGKGRHQVFQSVMHVTARKRLQLTGDLRRAVDRSEFSVDYQPLVNLTDGRMLGAEALVRWEHPEYGRISPGDFVPLAEETGLIVPIGEFVLGEACRQAREWQTQHPEQGDVYVSVNLSPRQFRPPGRLVEVVTRITGEHGLDPSTLLLEITESVLMNDRDNAAKDLQALREMGVRVAIDDFGTGYSSLAYLRDFPIDIVKMDRSFVRELGRGRADDALVRSVVELGEALNMQIVAEGIEDVAQLDSLRDLDCAIGQGYYFSQPVSGEQINDALRAPKGAPAEPAS